MGRNLKIVAFIGFQLQVQYNIQERGSRENGLEKNHRSERGNEVLAIILLICFDLFAIGYFCRVCSKLDQCLFCLDLWLYICQLLSRFLNIERQREWRKIKRIQESRKFISFMFFYFNTCLIYLILNFLCEYYYALLGHQWNKS